MRIGELAAAVGVTTRTVRHYHHLGLLPEPERLSNGYRRYTLRHAVVLARIRRLTGLGLSLTEVRDVLAEGGGTGGGAPGVTGSSAAGSTASAGSPGEGKDLVEVLTELDEDLARQEAAIRERRQRLRTLLDAGELPAEGPVSPRLAALLAALPEVDSPMAAKDREILALVDTGAGAEEGERLLTALRGALDDPDTVTRAREAYALLDALADAGPDDPRVARAARMLADCVPPDLLTGGPIDLDHALLRALYADFAPAQAEAVRRTLEILSGEGA
ncbi:MerR family transcriptional regulator [Streptomyces actinomycinicus]|uniref:MerR family transcriptional regulator n=1 Tax=Streptomyces actinomycinicus TaxID=1695166 RepID=A0A937JM88_9ACTN|nr:MerR family transcriptional regulator [Streptomyces actinomycinicus]MBL1081027.1 MerR family transcriptional regulator [Streptomyces actinomycinicus]